MNYNNLFVNTHMGQNCHNNLIKSLVFPFVIKMFFCHKVTAQTIKFFISLFQGTGIQGHDHQGGQLWRDQEISSPWDVCIFKCQQPEGNSLTHDVLIIAMAGTHQVWALFLEDTIWWKGKKYPAGTCVSIAGKHGSKLIILCPIISLEFELYSL